MRRRLKRISACLLAGIVLLTSMTGYAAQNGGESAEEIVQRLHAIALAGLPASVHARSAGQTEHLTTGTQIDYYGSRTRRYTVNGEEAYCVEPRVSGPSSGDYRVTEAYTVDTEGHGALDIRYLRAAMWFSYGAPGFDKSMWPDTYYDGTTMDADDYRVCSHLLVSKVFQNGSAAVKVGCTAGFYNWYWRYITGDYRNDASIDRKNPWNQIAFDGRVNEVPDTFRVYFLYTGTGTQLIAFWDYEPEGYVRLVKGAKAEDITAGNACYDLSGAVYGVYADRACRDRKGVLETKADGQSETVKLDAGDYFVKETGAPEGYALAPAPRGERPVAGQRRVAVPVGQQLVDGALGHPGQLGLRLDHRPHALEGALALGPAVLHLRPLLPVFRDRVPVQAVPPRYVAEVRLGPGGPVHVQLAHHVPLHPRSSRRVAVLGWSIFLFARLVKARLRGWRVSVSADGAMRLREWLFLH